jgi:hypothetical protein
VKNILLVAKTKALLDKSQTVNISHIHHALNNVFIENVKIEKFIYHAFGASYQLPEAKYTNSLIESTLENESAAYDEHLQAIFTKIKERNHTIDFMSISKLNTLEKFESRYLKFCISLYSSLDQGFVAPLYDAAVEYNCDEASEQLGLSHELIDELLEDYVEQILRTNGEFHLHLSDMWQDQFFGKELDYMPLRDLAHKNLGVAKNLRIQTAIEILNALEKEQNLHKISQLLNLLLISAIRLKPKKACESMFESVEELKKFQRVYSKKILQNIRLY